MLADQRGDVSRGADPGDVLVWDRGSGVFSIDLSVPGGELQAGGVTWITVAPTHRRRGILRSMMRLMVDDCHARNEPLAMLWIHMALTMKTGRNRAKSAIGSNSGATPATTAS